MNNANKKLKIFIGVISLVALIFVIYYAIKKERNNLVETITVWSEDKKEADKPSNNKADKEKKNYDEDITGVKKTSNKNGKIRVLLSDEAEGYIQSYVEISCNTSYMVNDGNEVISYEKNEIMTINEDTMTDGSISITPDKEKGRITISSIKKGGGTPSYRGTISVTKYSGGYVMVNELPVEQYLYGVVSSEVPAEFEIEALKAQAVCARGFAYNKLENPSFEKYGADLDDTTSSQVYNNFPENDNAVYAVNETSGIIPVYNDNYINAVYFSTSCGVTCSNSDAWGGNPEEYLLPLMEDGRAKPADLSNEDSFRTFIDENKINGRSFDAFEEDMPFYRWTAAYTYEDMEEAVNKGVYSCSSDCLFILKNDKYEPIGTSFPDIGEIKSVTVTKRGDSGIAKEVVIKGSTNTIKCTGQNNIRYIFCPENVVITKQDGSEQSYWTMLPSAFFYITEDEASGQYIIKGGGFGHGAGMSQNGANEMAKSGYTYDEIVKHYYTGISLKRIE